MEENPNQQPSANDLSTPVDPATALAERLPTWANSAEARRIGCRNRETVLKRVRRDLNRKGRRELARRKGATYLD